MFQPGDWQANDQFTATEQNSHNSQKCAIFYLENIDWNKFTHSVEGRHHTSEPVQNLYYNA
jgi:hypothetical protein